MCVATLPHRNSPPALLLRESFREQGQVRNRTLTNLSHWPREKVEALRQVWKGNWATGLPRPQAFEIARNHVQPKMKSVPAFEMMTRRTAAQQRALELLGVSL